MEEARSCGRLDNRMENNDVVSKENDRKYKARSIVRGEENIPEAWLSVSLLSTRWYSPASLVAGSRGVYCLPTSQLSRTMHTIDVTLSRPA